MIDCTEIVSFLDKYVAIGVPNDIIEGKLIFYFGTLKSADTLEVKIETKIGYKIIQIQDIQDIHLAGGSNGYR